MKSNIILKTSSKNNYIYNRNAKQFFLSHPIFCYIIELVEKQINLNNWFNNLTNKTQIDNEFYSKNEIQYYLEKHVFFQTNKQLEKDTFFKTVDFNMSKEDVEFYLANNDDLGFEVTERCNLKCKYCTYSDEHFDWFDKRKNSDLSYKKAVNLLSFIFPFLDSSLNKSHNLNFRINFYGGEPLLNFNLIKRIVNFIESYGLKRIKIIYGITTNCILLEKYADYLVEKNFHMLLSLDGNKMHNCYRVFHDGKPAYDSIIKNINYLKENYPDFFETNVLFNTVLNNKSSVSEIYSFFNKTFKITPIISEINADGIKAEKKKEFLKIYKNFRESLSQAEDYAQIEKEKLIFSPQHSELKKFIIYNTDHTYNTFYDVLYENLSNKTTITGTCNPFAKIFLTVGGKILPCENVNHKYCIGTVADDDTDINFNKIATIFNDFYNKMLKKCSNCYISRNCDQCIFLLNMEDKTPVCEGFMNKQDFKSYLAARINLIENEPILYSKIITNSQKFQ